MHAAAAYGRSAVRLPQLIFSIPAFTDAILILVLPMAENRVLSQFPAVNESLHEPRQKRDQQKAKRSRRKQQQNLFCLPNPVKDKAEFCFQKYFHISRSDFRSISASILPHTAPKRVFHVPIIPCFCHFASLIRQLHTKHTLRFNRNCKV